MKSIASFIYVIAVLSVVSCKQHPASVFSKADIDNDGKLTPKEATDMLMSGMFELYDSDGNKKVSEAEWKKYHTEMRVFKANDTNKDGVLTLEETQTKAYRDQIFNQLFRQADANGDGFVTLEEAEAFSDEYYSAVR